MTRQSDPSLRSHPRRTALHAFGVDPKEVHGEDPSTGLAQVFLAKICPRDEGEGNQAVWRVSDETSSAGGVGWAAERMKDEEKANE